jgi:hypothetical protein
MSRRPAINADEVLDAVARLVGATEYAALILRRADWRRVDLLTESGAELARAELALTDLLAGESYDPRARVRDALRTAREEARSRAEAVTAEPMQPSEES